MLVLRIRSLPNWRGLHETSSDQSNPVSEADLRAMNSKESNILTANLSSTDIFIPQQEVITDPATLRSLGNLCESLVSALWEEQYY